MTAWIVVATAWIALLAASVPHRPVAPRRAVRTGAVAAFHDRRHRERRARARTADLAAAADLLGVGLSVGLSVRAAIEALVRHGDDATGCGLETVVGAVRAGASLDHALDRWAAQLGDPAGELAAVLVAADRRGVAVGAALDRLSCDLRRRRRRSAEAAARRLTVRMLVPLVCCILPAFALLVVAPMVAAGLGDALGAV